MKTTLEKFDSIYCATANKFKTLEDNRGADGNVTNKEGYTFPKGIEPQRVMRLVEIFLSSMGFIWSIGMLDVIIRPDGYLYVLDGNHRLEMVKYLIFKGILPKKFKIPFRVITEESLQNLSDLEYVTIMSEINNVDSTWSQTDVFKIARKKNLDAMKAIDLFISILELHKDDLAYVHNDRNRNALSTLKRPATAFAFIKGLTKTPTGQDGRLTLSKLIENADILDIVQSKEFQKQSNEYIRFFIEYGISWHMQRNLRLSKIIDAYLSIVNNEKTLFNGKDINKALANTNRMPKDETKIKSFILNRLHK